MDATPPAPRRSQRDRKTVKPFHSAAAPGSARKKRKRSDTDAEDESPLTTEAETEGLEDDGDDEDREGDEDDEDDDGEEYHTPTAKTSTVSRKGKAKATPKVKVLAHPPKKARSTKVQREPKLPKPATARKVKKAKDGVDALTPDQLTKETNILNDNPLFNALVNPAMPLQSTAEDFMEALRESPANAQAEVVNLILRSCGCNDSVDADSALDYDGVVDALDNFTEVLKQENSPVYPLTSKLPGFRKFRKHLAEFIERLISASAELGLLYSTDLMATLQTWVIAMSSSQIRSFRHTATVIALDLETALCDVAASVEKEAEVVSRQREGEKKRKASNKSASVARLKELEVKAKEIRGRRKKIAEMLKEFVDGVFVHRYRDLDPNIRAECVRAIGLWFKKYPGHFLDGAYLRYVGWVLSDSATHVRLEAVRALSNVYNQADFINSLNHFTERFKPRLIEMATLDVDLSVRVAVIQILAAIDGYSLLEDDEREKLCLLVFDQEARIRKAVSGFVRGIWSEAVEERSMGTRGSRKKPSAKDKERVGIKVLSSLLVQWGRHLDQMLGDLSDVEDDDVIEEAEGNAEKGESRRTKRLRRQDKPRRELVSLLEDGKGRTAFVVEALWGKVEPVSDWEGLLEILLLDHSASLSNNDDDDLPAHPGAARRVNGRAHRSEEAEDEGEAEVVEVVVIDDSWRLEEVEEGILLEVLVASIRKTKADAAGAKKTEEETIVNDITRELIKGLPRLFIKHQIDTNRIAEVLLIPPLMNLDLYLEMRMIPSYAGLWDNVTKQFLSHSSLTVLARAVACIRFFMEATSLSNTNNTKMSELEEELSSTLRDAVAGREEIEIASFNEDEVLTLGTICTRLAVFFGTRDMTAWMEEDEGGKQSNAWDIISAISERGRLGYKEEETMVEQALQILALHIMWKTKGLTADEAPPLEQVKLREKLEEQRGALLEKLSEYAIGGRSNTVEGVKRSAFKSLLDIHVLFTPILGEDEESFPTNQLPLTLDDETQYRCAGYMQAEIERYAELVGESHERPESEHESGSGSEESDDEQPPQKQVKKKQVKPTAQRAKSVETRLDVLSRAELEQEYLFIDVVTTYLRAIRIGAINPRHGAVLLAHYGRLGSAFDICTKIIIDVLREEGMSNDNADVVVTVVTHAMQEAFNLVLDGVVQGDDNVQQLAKVLSGCLAIRGTQLSIVKRLDSEYVVQIHMTLITWIVKRLSAYDKNKNKKQFKLAMSFFRLMVPLLWTVRSKDALDIKAHMDQALAQAKLEPLTTSKVWEPQRAYEKRLGTALSKDKPAGSKGRRGKGAKSGAAATDESEVEKTTDDEGVGKPKSPAPPPPQAMRPKPRRVTRAHPDIEIVPEAEDMNDDVPVANGDAAADHEEQQLATPKPLNRRKAGDKDRTPTRALTPPAPAEEQRSPELEAEEKEQTESPIPPPQSGSRAPSVIPSQQVQVQERPDDADDDNADAEMEMAVITPKMSRKRHRPDDMYQVLPTTGRMEQQQRDVQGTEMEEASPAVADVTPIRRKRIRH
ncbi:hypothetical protein AMATHDRAFT_3582 [Amanita thiersii Skay4041]|uniref:SCD domain-containing protein n=1 Tax=Amanita thiersii Skay4041 TaxID=703135 RepID=A0A2A9NJT3_9AGAR|nr:hypothetical protein AMATHDRAFT_3582 [Amanita thiersii Skay4041]